MFEILGNSKNPVRLNKHIKKIFSGMKVLNITS